jgi:hypothetical protein
MRESMFDRELQQQVAHASRLMQVAHDGDDAFTADAYDARRRELEEIAARNGIRMRR